MSGESLCLLHGWWLNSSTSHLSKAQDRHRTPVPKSCCSIWLAGPLFLSVYCRIRGIDCSRNGGIEPDIQIAEGNRDWGVSGFRCIRGFGCYSVSAAGMRSANVTANALSAGFHRMVHRA